MGDNKKLTNSDPMNWTRGLTKQYGIFLCFLGFVLGCLITYIIMTYGN